MFCVCLSSRSACFGKPLTGLPAAGMWVMADVVLNHVGYGDLAHGYKPFYKSEYFHNCTVLATENVGALKPSQCSHCPHQPRSLVGSGKGYACWSAYFSCAQPLHAALLS